MISENRSDMIMCDNDESLQFMPLLHMPTKPIEGLLNLSNIQSNGKMLCNKFVDVQVLVRDVRIFTNILRNMYSFGVIRKYSTPERIKVLIGGLSR